MHPSSHKHGYLYETHCHTAKISACGRISAEEIVDLYLASGFAGVIVTDHFLQGNCRITYEHPDLPYPERIHMFFEGYREVKAAAADRLDVFFGFERSYGGTDVLVYGLDEPRLQAIPEIETMDMRTFIRFMNELGALTVQAHPFREASYIDHIRLYTDTQGVEIYNSCRDDLSNRLAEFYWHEYDRAVGKAFTAGSDLHAVSSPAILGGMRFPERLASIDDFIQAVREKKGIVEKVPNPRAAVHG